MRWLLVVALLLAARDADACGNGIRLKGDKAVQFVAEREKALAEGRYEAVLANHEFFLQDRKLRDRVSAAWDAAYMRHKKKWKWFVDNNWSEVRNSQKDDLLLQARYAEARSRLSKKEKERALKTLTDLATRDLIVEPEGWEALARLRKEAGDDAGAAEATKRCKAMTKREVCGD